MSKALKHFRPNWVVPPGSTIIDLLEENGWTQAELANRTGFTRKHISQLIKGQAPINEETALKLERVLGGTMQFWLTRELFYREALARKEEKEALEKDCGWLQELPLKEMIAFKWINKFTDKTEQVRECLRFFGVGSVEVWRRKWECDLAAYRSKSLQNKHRGFIASWIRQCEKKAYSLNISEYKEEKFKEILLQVRELTQNENSDRFIPELIRLCGEAGVALVTLQALRGCPVSGATRWLSSDKPLLMLSDRYKSSDQFWFTFFHEAAHLLFHAKKVLYIDTDGQLDNEDEKKANNFATNTLIPSQYLNELFSLPVDEKSIRRFAKEIQIAPAIVLGRLQREQLVRWDTKLNKIKIKIHFPNC